jgi:DNA-binding transcriptional regulator GbsR (MarR family)
LAIFVCIINLREMSDKELREHIEETGKVIERFGLTPMQGRILAYLTSSEKSEATFAELVKYFSASKSSVSTSLNYLLSIRMLDYKTYSSERKKFFFLTEDFFVIYFSQVLDNVSILKEICYKTLSNRSAEHTEVSNRILKWVEAANIFELSMSEVINEISTD